MNIRYYLGWFNQGLTDDIADLLKKDIKNRQSLVMISANMSHKHLEVVGETERSWLDQAGISFESYHLIDDETDKERAHSWVESASVIFFLGGNTQEQNKLLHEYHLLEKVKKSQAIILGTSAGAINMSAKWMSSENENNMFTGVALDEFSVLSHYDLENHLYTVQEDYKLILKEMTLYASNKDCAIRIEGNKFDIIGDVYRVTESDVLKMTETLR